jgi:hypothetical protein
MSKQTDMQELRMKVSGLASLGLSDHEYLGWLESYVSRAHEILRPSETPAVDNEGMRQTILREYTQFGSDQAALDWAHRNKISLSKGPWWWLNPDNRTGNIIGLEGSHGIPRITNGIDVWIERGDGSTFLGHRDWLKYDRRKADLTKDSSAKPTKEFRLNPLDELLLELAAKSLESTNTPPSV